MMNKPHFRQQPHPMIRLIGLLSAAITLMLASSPAQSGDTVIELWDTIKAPLPVAVKAVKVDPAKTAFLVLDIEQRTCNSQTRPRCIEAVPKIKDFLDKVRAKGVFVAYSLTSLGTPETILPQVSPLGGEPVVKSSVDKFFNTDLEKILRGRGIDTVIIAGTTAEGAVIHTATGASMRGFKVIVPVDGMPAGTLYAEQYSSWHLLNAPGTRQNTTLTRFDMIGF